MDPQNKALNKKIIQHIQALPTFISEEKSIRKLCENFIESENILKAPQEKEGLIQSVVDHFLAWGILTPFLRDPRVSEIMVNGLKPILLEIEGQLQISSVSFEEENFLLELIQRMVGLCGRRIDESHPLVDARLPDGSRLNAIIPPLSLMGPIITIRKFPIKVLTLEDLELKGSLNPKMRIYLERAIRGRKNILICGGTGSGKTSLLNACASLIPTTERLITIEDAAEIKIDHPHHIALESRPPSSEGQGEITIRTLLRNALRMRPDRIIVGEIRGSEALDMLQAMNTGHRGSMTTLHANSPLEGLLRLETLALSGEIKIPLEALRMQIIQALDLILYQERQSDGSRKITALCEINKKSSATYELIDLLENQHFF